jgi:hypothetical protein
VTPHQLAARLSGSAQAWLAAPLIKIKKAWLAATSNRSRRGDHNRIFFCFQRPTAGYLGSGILLAGHTRSLCVRLVVRRTQLPQALPHQLGVLKIHACHMPSTRSCPATGPKSKGVEPSHPLGVLQLMPHTPAQTVHPLQVPHQASSQSTHAP